MSQNLLSLGMLQYQSILSALLKRLGVATKTKMMKTKTTTIQLQI